MGTCIWCKEPTDNEPDEHILPEGLVGEARFAVVGANDDVLLVLKDDEVCLDCNVKRLNPLDTYLQKQLGIFKVFLNRTGNKRGRPAKIEKPGIFGIHRSDGPHIYLNAEKKRIVTEDGIVIQPTQNHPDAVHLTAVKKTGTTVEANFTFNMRLDSKPFRRALYKIGFEMLCFQQGTEVVLDPRFDPIRDYVLRARGSRDIFASQSLNGGEWERPGVTMHKIAGTPDWIAELRLGPMFFVDLGPDGGFTGGTGTQLEEKRFRRLSDTQKQITDRRVNDASRSAD